VCPCLECHHWWHQSVGLFNICWYVAAVHAINFEPFAEGVVSFVDACHNLNTPSML
jgi:hypothetical protein